MANIFQDVKRLQKRVAELQQEIEKLKEQRLESVIGTNLQGKPLISNRERIENEHK